MDLPKRKTVRLQGYDYNTPGYYFITVCTEDKKPMLCKIVGTGLPDGPQVVLSAYGKIADKQLQTMRGFYSDVRVDKYVIMPNHIHLILVLEDGMDGPSGRPVPTDTKIARFVGTFKRFCNRRYGKNIWQYRSYDHVIRSERDYRKIWQYIDGNPGKWMEDCFYIADTITGNS